MFIPILEEPCYIYGLSPMGQKPGYNADCIDKNLDNAGLSSNYVALVSSCWSLQFHYYTELYVQVYDFT